MAGSFHSFLDSLPEGNTPEGNTPEGKCFKEKVTKAYSQSCLAGQNTPPVLEAKVGLMQKTTGNDWNDGEWVDG